MAQPPELRRNRSMRDDRAVAINRPQSASSFTRSEGLRLQRSEAIDRAALGVPDRVVPLTMQVCPADEREGLRMSLAGMRRLDDPRRQRLRWSCRSRARRSAGSTGTNTGTVADVASRTARRLSLVVEQLAKHLPFASASPEPQAHEARRATQTMAAAGVIEAELRPTCGSHKTVHRRRDRSGEALPTFSLRTCRSGSRARGGEQPAAIEAMHKIIALTPARTARSVIAS
jgi:hypothetical protein